MKKIWLVICLFCLWLLNNDVLALNVNNDYILDNLNVYASNLNIFDCNCAPNDSNCSKNCMGSCADLSDIEDFITKYIFTPLRYVIIIFFVLFTSVDFAKSIFGSDKADIKKPVSNLEKRVIVCLIFFFIPTIVELLIDLLEIGCH